MLLLQNCFVTRLIQRDVLGSSPYVPFPEGRGGMTRVVLKPRWSTQLVAKGKRGASGMGLKVVVKKGVGEGWDSSSLVLLLLPSWGKIWIVVEPSGWWSQTNLARCLGVFQSGLMC